MRIVALLTLLLPVLTIAQVKYTNESKKLYTKAVKEYKDGNVDEALDLFKECTAADPRYAEAYLNMSYIQYSKKLMGDALTNAKLAYHHNKLQSAIYDQLGKCYYMAMDYDSSAYFISKGIEMGENGELSYIYGGKSYYELEDYTTAEELLTKAIELNDKNPVSYNSRGKVYFQRAEYIKAENDFKKALELNPNSVGLYANLSNTLLDNNKAEEALEYINLGMDKANDQEKVQLLLLLGNYYHNAGEFDKANETFEHAYELDESNAYIINNQAAVLLDQDKYEEAIAKLDLALDLQPEMMEAYFNRGIAYEMLRRVEEACSDWEQAFILGSEKAEEYLNSPTCNE